MAAVVYITDLQHRPCGRRGQRPKKRAFVCLTQPAAGNIYVIDLHANFLFNFNFFLHSFCCNIIFLHEPRARNFTTHLANDDYDKKKQINKKLKYTRLRASYCFQGFLPQNTIYI